MASEGMGKTFLPPHCSCIHPCSYYFVVEVNPCFTALYVVPGMLSSLLFQSSHSAGITQGASAQLKGAVSVQAGQEPCSALTMSNKPSPAAAHKVCLF